MSPRNPDQNQAIRDERREQILRAALKVFARKGFIGAKISDIAKEGDLSHGLIYHYFPSKDAIFSELVKIAGETSLGVFKLASEKAGTPLQRLGIMTEMIVSAAYQGEGPYWFYIMIQAATSDAVLQEIREMISTSEEPSYLDYLLPLISEGQQIGEIAEGDGLRLAMLYLSIIQGLAVMQMQNAEPIPMPTTEMILRIFTK